MDNVLPHVFGKEHKVAAFLPIIHVPDTAHVGTATGVDRNGSSPYAFDDEAGSGAINDLSARVGEGGGDVCDEIFGG